ncbi:MAG: phospholipase C, phosphocholine-specific [Thermoflavifilum aggregans]|nr:phospholipase C, phosphocholine-specific [Thermoflavifilum aggregans]
MDTRRDFLKKAMLLSAATGLSSAMPPSIQRALAIDPDPGSTFMDAEHVVILMQENRSFDHCFGALRGVRGFNDPRTITQPNGNRVWIQTDKNGDSYVPFRFDIQQSKVTWMGSLPHSRASQVDAYNGGKYDQWLNAKRSSDKKFANMPLTLGYYTREDLPFYYAMADAFTICDQYFCSAMTSTWPNRLFLWSGTVRAEKNDTCRAYMNNYIPWGEEYLATFPELLEKNGISWRVYQNDLSSGGGLTGDQRAWLANFGCNPLEFLSQYNVRFFPRYYQSLQKRAAELPDQIAELEKKFSTMSPGDQGYDKLQREIAKKKEVLQDTQEQLTQWDPNNFDKLTTYQKNLYNKAFTTNKEDPDYHQLTTLQYEDKGVPREVLIPKGDVLYQFRKDVENGNLPAVSWLVPSQNFSDHPSAPWYGVWLTSEILDILTKNPEVWKKTIFILTYDENDGYFDHIPPFVAPDPKDKSTGKCSPGVNVTGAEYTRKETQVEKYGWKKNDARTAPVGLGFRVPMIIASPWSRGGKVYSQVSDHTSILQFLETYLSNKYQKNIKQTTISEWRRTICGNLTAAFSKFEEGKETLPFLKMDPFIERIYNAKFAKKPTGYKKLTQQEIDEINKNPAASRLMALQEPGTRPACPLPYQLYVDGNLNSDKKSFQLNMQAKNEVFGKYAAGSPFKVYAPGNYLTTAENGAKKTYEAARSWDYAVKAGDLLTDEWPLDSFENKIYHLRVYGPNGFFREFMGNANDPSLKITCEYERGRLRKNKLTGNIALTISNQDTAQSHQVTITDNAYKNKPISRTVPAGGEVTVILDLKKSHQWYDFTLTVNGNKLFAKRYAGRVETGAETFSDPAMGRVV